MRTNRIAVVAAAALVVSGLFAASPALAASTGTVTVQLVTPAGKPLAIDSSVEVFTPHGGSYDKVQSTDGSTGSTVFSSVPAGTTLTVDAYGFYGYLGSTKTGVKVPASGAITVKLPHAKGATVSGTLTKPGGAAALSGVDVTLFTSSGRLVEYGTTDSTGAYSIIGVSSGKYRVQFDERQNSVQTAYSWSYWAGRGKPSTAKWTKAKVLKVTQQTAKSAASMVTNVNGSALSGVTLSGTVNYWSDASSHAGGSVKFVAPNPADSFYGELDSSGKLFSTQVNPGRYRVAILGDYNDILAMSPLYWYVSDSNGPATTESKATWVRVDTDTSITFNKARAEL